MRAIIKYISLLLFSGLIIPFYHYHLPGQAIPVDKKEYPGAHKHSATVKKAKKRFTLLNETVAEILPVLKNLH